MGDSIQRIGILTSGGDCPGLNAVIRAVAKTAMYEYGLDVVGIEDGYLGIIEDRMRPLNAMDVSNILTVGGTILGTSNKYSPVRYPVGKNEDGSTKFGNVMDRCLENLDNAGIDALVVIGGDGTMRGAGVFVEAGVNCIGVPKTIDNDILGTDITFGFMTAVDVATDALDRIHTTAASHHRAMVVEVMGRNAGWISLTAGVASGSDVILIPEIPYDIDAVCEYVEERSKKGKRFTILCISEGVKPVGGEQHVVEHVEGKMSSARLGGVGEVIADQVEEKTGIESRCTVLGHVQRGGSPVPQDRLLGTMFGHHAVEIMMAGKKNRLVVMEGRDVTDIELIRATKGQKTVPLDHPLIPAARAIGTSFGEPD